MGTYVTIEAPKIENIQKGFEIVKRIEDSLSTFKKDSLVYRLNETKRVEPDRYLYDIVKKSLQIYKESDGYFNIAVGKITKDLYRFGEDERVPKSLPHISLEPKITFFEKQMTIPTGMKVDFGGIAKGYAVDEVAKEFRGIGVKKATIALSGDIRCFGTCVVSIDSPFGEDAPPIAYIYSDKEEFAISTSGIYRRFVKTRQNNHIINPYTKKPQTRILSLSLFGRYDNYYLDATATAVVAMGFEKAIRFLKKKKIPFILVTSDNKLYINRGGYKVALVENGMRIEPFCNTIGN